MRRRDFLSGLRNAAITAAVAYSPLSRVLHRGRFGRALVAPEVVTVEYYVLFRKEPEPSDPNEFPYVKYTIDPKYLEIVPQEPKE